MLLRTAWVCDDAYITLRTVDNLLAGYGPRWNVVERVQVYTHPLWMLLLAGAVGATREYFVTTALLSCAVSLGAVFALAFGVARTPAAAVLAVLALTSSRAFVDYSSAGLENPLTHLLLAGFLLVFFGRGGGERRLLLLSLLASLLALSRPDALLLVGPALLAAARGVPRRRAAAVLALGMAPLLVWEAFSLVYYGFLFPNTAWAKLATGIERGALLAQGARYLANSLRTDPPTLALVALGAAAPAVVGPRRGLPVAAGALLYVAYVVSIGGDFMSGRFLSAPLFAGVALLARVPWPAAAPRTWITGAALVAAAFLLPGAPARSGADYGADRGEREVELDAGIADERLHYYPWTGLLRRGAAWREPDHRWVRVGRHLRESDTRVARYGVIGFLGFHAGPRVHVVDHFALADPLLARLPARADDWRIGHFRRSVPEGYLEGVATGASRVRDPEVAALDEALRSITRGPLFSCARWKAIWDVHRGRYDGAGDDGADAKRPPSN